MRRVLAAVFAAATALCMTTTSFARMTQDYAEAYIDLRGATELKVVNSGIQTGSSTIRVNEKGEFTCHIDYVYTIGSPNDSSRLQAIAKTSNLDVVEVRSSTSSTLPEVTIGSSQKEGTYILSIGYKGVGTGTADITLTALGKVVKTFSVTVEGEIPEPVVNSVSVNPAEIELVPGEHRTLTADVQGDNLTADDKQAVWSTSDFTTVQVDPRTGEIEARKAGEAIITARAGGVEGTCKVTVKEGTIDPSKPVVEAVHVIPSKTTMYVGQRKWLRSSVDGFNLGFGDSSLTTWSSKDETLAVVDDDGSVIAKAVGTVEIVATSKADPSKSAVCVITIVPEGSGSNTPDTDTPDVDPKPDVTPPDNGSSSGGSSGGSSSSSSNSSSSDWSSYTNRNTFSGNVDGLGKVKAAKAASDMDKAAEKAAAAGSATAQVSVRNAKSVSADALRAIAQAAQKSGVRGQLLADQVVNGKIASRLYIDPAKAANLNGDIRLGVTVGNPKVERAFSKLTSEKVAVVSFEQKNNFGMDIEVAAKADLDGMDVKSLKFYSYDAAANRYYQVFPEFFVDANGYLHFTTGVGNHMVITNASL